MDDNAPPFLTVEEAAHLLRIGRTKAYAMAREWRETGGRSGLPVVDLGDVLRVPSQSLEKHLGARLAGVLVPVEKARGEARPEPDPAPPTSPTDDGALSAARPRRPTRSRREPLRPNQLHLFEALPFPDRQQARP